MVNLQMMNFCKFCFKVQIKDFSLILLYFVSAFDKLETCTSYTENCSFFDLMQ